LSVTFIFGAVRKTELCLNATDDYNYTLRYITELFYINILLSIMELNRLYTPTVNFSVKSLRFNFVMMLFNNLNLQLGLFEISQC
jgi:hypothetical protein